MDWMQFVMLAVLWVGGLKYVHQDLKTQGARTDKLYEMFIDLLKEGKR